MEHMNNTRIEQLRQWAQRCAEESASVEDGMDHEEENWRDLARILSDILELQGRASVAAFGEKGGASNG
jgi:hypothetical protein